MDFDVKKNFRNGQNFHFCTPEIPAKNNAVFTAAVQEDSANHPASC